MIMELLYNGRIYPSEAIMSQDERFTKAEAKVNDLLKTCSQGWTIRTKLRQKRSGIRCTRARATPRKKTSATV